MTKKENAISVEKRRFYIGKLKALKRNGGSHAKTVDQLSNKLLEGLQMKWAKGFSTKARICLIVFSVLFMAESCG